ncbi:MAG: hypothetical protein ACE5G3_07285, partial [Gammaproteobacteria bacterium]
MAFEQGLRQWYWETMHRRSSPQVQLATDYDTAAAVAEARAVQSQYFADLNYPNAKQKRAFPAYTCLADFAQRQECGNIVEIGAGLSTAVWARYAQSSG